MVELARGAVAAEQGRHEQADEAHDRALAAFTTYRLPWGRAETLLSWARWRAAEDRPVEAAEKRRAAWAVSDELGASERWRQRLAKLS